MHRPHTVHLSLSTQGITGVGQQSASRHKPAEFIFHRGIGEHRRGKIKQGGQTVEKWLYLLAGLILLVLLGVPVFMAPVDLRVRYGREGEKDLLDMELSLWRHFRYRYRVDMVDVNVNLLRVILRYRSNLQKGSGRVVARERKRIKSPGILEIYRMFFFWKDIYGLARPSVNYFKSRVRISYLSWKTRFGLGDPFRTGMATGMIWSLKGYIVTFLFSQIKVSGVPALAVVPDFSRACFTIRLDCRLATRAGYILFAGMRLLAALLFGGRLLDIVKIAKKTKRKFSVGDKKG